MGDTGNPELDQLPSREAVSIVELQRRAGARNA